MNWRKWNRIIHRDLGYICCGLTILYAISGLAVNHIAEWNPTYKINRESSTLDLTEAAKNTEDLARYILQQLNETGAVNNIYRQSPDILKIYVAGNTITATLSSGEIMQEKTVKRPLLYHLNFLHLNHPKKLWTWFADMYALALCLLALSGIFMISGKKGITGRGAWLISAGIAIPLIFLFLYG